MLQNVHVPPTASRNRTPPRPSFKMGDDNHGYRWAICNFAHLIYSACTVNLLRCGERKPLGHRRRIIGPKLLDGIHFGHIHRCGTSRRGSETQSLNPSKSKYCVGSLRVDHWTICRVNAIRVVGRIFLSGSFASSSPPLIPLPHPPPPRPARASLWSGSGWTFSSYSLSWMY